MGEAKRRKQLDASYGKTHSLVSLNQQQKHVDAIASELSYRFKSEIKEIAAAESIIDNYDSYKEFVSNWLHPKLEQYRPSDRLTIASSIMTLYAEIAMQYESSPLLIKFWFEVLEPFLSEDKKARIDAIVGKINAEFT